MALKLGWALDLWRQNALLALGLVLFLGGLGIPGPATIAIVATGALVRAGGVSPFAALSIGLGCAAVGDFVSYSIARRGLGRWMEKRKRRPSWSKAVKRFEKNATMTLFLARWLFTPISLPSTYIAGSSKYPVAKFLAASLLGQAVWIGLYGGIGYGVGRHWPRFTSELASKAGWIAGGGAVIGLAVWAVWRRGHKKAEAAERYP